MACVTSLSKAPLAVCKMPNHVQRVFADLPSTAQHRELYSCLTSPDADLGKKNKLLLSVVPFNFVKYGDRTFCSVAPQLMSVMSCGIHCH